MPDATATGLSPLQRWRKLSPMVVRLIVVLALFMLLPVPEAGAADDVDCYYRDKARESITYSDYCGLVSDSKIIRLVPEWMEKVHFDPDGLSCVFFSRENLFWVRRDGTSIRVPTWDNGCARFQEGLTIAEVDGRQMYIDKSLAIVLDPGYDSLELFDGGYAKVCNGPFQLVPFRAENGEQTRRTGGACGMIDRSGTLVMDLIHPTEDSVAFRDFRNAHNHCAPPPIENESAALCHAMRHAMREREDWTNHSVEQQSDQWEVVYSFMIDHRERTNSIELGTEKAEVRWHGQRDLRRR